MAKLNSTWKNTMHYVKQIYIPDCSRERSPIFLFGSIILDGCPIRLIWDEWKEVHHPLHWQIVLLRVAQQVKQCSKEHNLWVHRFLALLYSSKIPWDNILVIGVHELLFTKICGYITMWMHIKLNSTNALQRTNNEVWYNRCHNNSMCYSRGMDIDSRVIKIWHKNLELYGIWKYFKWIAHIQCVHVNWKHPTQCASQKTAQNLISQYYF